jgi:5-methyltetrahydrofolate--homocysteine methyltransferase
MTGSSLYEGLSSDVIEGRVEAVKTTVEKLLSQGVEPMEIIECGLTPGIDEVGTRYARGEMFVPEMVRSAQAMVLGMDLVKPHLRTGQDVSRGTVVIGSVRGDIHNIGKNLLAMLLEAGGFAVQDLGVDVSPEAFVRAAQDESADIVAMSALLTTTMPRMRETIEALEAAGMRDRVRVLVGGAPLSADWAEEIGADGYGSDASAGLQLAKSMLHVAGARAFKSGRTDVASHQNA